MKIVVVIAFALIIASMASALVYLVRDRGRSRHVVRALTVRVGFSVALFLFVLFANWMGWIESTGIPIQR